MPSGGRRAIFERGHVRVGERQASGIRVGGPSQGNTGGRGGQGKSQGPAHGRGGGVGLTQLALALGTMSASAGHVPSPPPSRALPAFVSVGTKATDSGSALGSLAANLPTSVASGNLLMLFASVFFASGSSVGTPAGYTPLYDSGLYGASTKQRFYIFYKRAGGSESAPTLTVAASGTAFWDLCMAQYSGVNTSSPLDGAITTSIAASTTPTAPAITTTGANERVLSVLLAVSANTGDIRTDTASDINGFPTGTANRFNVWEKAFPFSMALSDQAQTTAGTIAAGSWAVPHNTVYGNFPSQSLRMALTS